MIFTFTGPEVLANGKRGFGYVDETGREWCFKKSISSARKVDDVIGGKYETELSGDSSVKLLAKYVGRHEDSDVIAQWEARAITTRAELSRRAEERRAKRDSPLLKGLDPIREEYRRSRGVGRRALLLTVLKYIME